MPESVLTASNSETLADLLPNAAFLAAHVQDMQLVLFEVPDGPSNLPSPQDVAKLAALGIADHFDHVLCAQDADIGRFKPHPRGLEVALRRLELDAAEVVFVGDRSEVDAVCAAAANIRCVIVGGSRARTDGTEYHTARTLREMAMMLKPT